MLPNHGGGEAHSPTALNPTLEDQVDEEKGALERTCKGELSVELPDAEGDVELHGARPWGGGMWQPLSQAVERIREKAAGDGEEGGELSPGAGERRHWLAHPYRYLPITAILLVLVLQVEVPWGSAVPARVSNVLPFRTVKLDPNDLKPGTCGSSSYCGYHHAFPGQCTQTPNVSARVLRAPKARPNDVSGGLHEEMYRGTELYTTQSCMYETLDKWWNITHTLGIKHWSLVAGSLIGSWCYKGIIPWDDDIDIHIGYGDCALLEKAYWSLEPNSALKAYDDNRFPGRKFNDDVDIFRAHDIFAGFMKSWWKVRLRNADTTPITQLDLNCADEHEWAPFGGEPFEKVFEDVPFGPTVARRLAKPYVFQWCCWHPNAWKESLLHRYEHLWKMLGTTSMIKRPHIKCVD
mmetsp:Transcript_12208/g.30645  ORF Transcript_12208/g.30645 Transcript_12208/m.30645 type:complete len:407 (+) Transcript_12208:118-1338(+)